MQWSKRNNQASDPRANYGPVIREIYARKPKWWARWTWPLLMGITVWSAVGAQTAFYHWSQRVEPSGNAKEKKESKGPTVANAGPAKPQRTEWELRPLNQRVLMSGAILAFGTGLGILFLSTRSGIVRRLSAVSRPSPFQRNAQTPFRQNSQSAQGIGSDVGPPSDFRYLLVETVANTSGLGKVFLKEECELLPGRDKTEMVLKAPGNRRFWMGLKGATVEGETSLHSVEVVRRKLLNVWDGKKGDDSGGRWVRGPVVTKGR